MLDPLELELQMIASHHVDAGNRTWSSGRATFTLAPLTTFFNLVSACVHMCRHYSHGEVRGQLMEVISLLPPCWSQGSNLGPHASWRVPLPTEPLC